MKEVIEWLKYFHECGVEGFDADTPGRNKEELMQELIAEIDDCKKCQLHKGRRHIVIADGSVKSRLMFIGEGPGEEEDKQGLPFVGRAGQLLNKMMAAIKLKREDVYIANIVKCRPPGNREPLPEEIKECYPYLEKQIKIVAPRLIVTLGAPASKTLLQTKTSISELRGKFFKMSGDMYLMPTFHPAFLLRNPNKKREAWEDLQKVEQFLELKS